MGRAALDQAGTGGPSKESTAPAHLASFNPFMPVASWARKGFSLWRVGEVKAKACSSQLRLATVGGTSNQGWRLQAKPCQSRTVSRPAWDWTDTGALVPVPCDQCPPGKGNIHNMNPNQMSSGHRRRTDGTGQTGAGQMSQDRWRKTDGHRTDSAGHRCRKTDGRRTDGAGHRWGAAVSPQWVLFRPASKEVLPETWTWTSVFLTGCGSAS